MASGKGRNAGASARAKLRNIAGREGVDFEYILTRYAIEGLLRRLSASPHRDAFVLKGAMLFVLWGFPHHRATRDVDFLGLGDMTASRLIEVFQQTATTPVESDGLNFLPDTVSASPIREATKYGGTRVLIRTELAGAVVTIQIDVGVGDAARACEEAAFPTILGGSNPILRAYPRDYSVAEKFHAMVEYGMINTRLKDYYDIRLLARTFPFDLSSLSEAIANTFARRGTPVPSGVPDALTNEYASDTLRARQWGRLLRKSRLEADTSTLEEAVQEVRAFLHEPIERARKLPAPRLVWSPATREWMT